MPKGVAPSRVVWSSASRQNVPFSSAASHYSRLFSTGAETAHNKVAKRNAETISRIVEGLAAGVQRGMKDGAEIIMADTASRFSSAYQRVLADTESGINRNAGFIQADPAEGVKSRDIQQLRDNKVAGPSDPALYPTAPNLAFKKIKLKTLALSQNRLDQVEDRTAQQMFTIEFLLPVESSKGGIRWFVRPLTIHGRGSWKTRRDPVTKQPWRLWRAIEYGQVSGNVVKVFVRSVQSYPAGEPAHSIENAVACLDVNGVTFGDWAVFMSPNGGYWERLERLCLQSGIDCIRVEKGGASYSGGEHPIAASVEAQRAQVRQAIIDGVRSELGGLLK